MRRAHVVAFVLLLSGGALGLLSRGALGADPVPGAPMFLPGEKVQAVFGSTGDARVGGIGLLAGMRFSVSAKASAGSHAKPTLTLARPTGAAVDPGSAGRLKPGHAQIVNFPADVTGVWRLTVATPSAGGGGVDISVKARPPKKVPAGQGLAGDGGGQFSFDALPGTTVSAVTVKCVAKPAWTPRIELVAPSGASLGAVDGTGATASLRNVVLDEVGTYRVRVTGGVGTFKHQVAIKLPKARAGLVWKDVESPPAVTGFSPTSVTNDAVTAFQLYGVGFTSDHLVLFNQGTSTRAAQPVYQTTDYGAVVSTELAGIPAGDYQVHVRTPAGNTVAFPGTLTIANRAPVVSSIYPPFMPQGQGLPCTINGAGIDANAAVTVRRTSDQVLVPSTVTLRSGHQRVDLRIDTAPYFTGACDIVVAESGAQTRTFSSVLDIVGWRAAPLSLVQYSGSDAASNFYPRDAAYDDTGGRVCLAVKEGTAVRYLLLDGTTLAVLDSTRISPPSGTTFNNPRVAFDPTSRTWALTWVASLASSAEARLRVVDAADLDLQRGSATLDASRYVLSVDAAADPDRGGFLVVWDRISSNTGPAEIRGRRVDGSGVLAGTAARTIVSHSGIYTMEPAIARQSAGTYVVAFSGVTFTGSQIAAHRVVVDGDGVVTVADTVCATDAVWYQLFQPEVGVQPGGGAVIVAFTYDDGAASAVYHPGTVPLTGPDLLPGALTTVDDDGEVPFGYIDSLVWNPTRSEFVIACTTGTQSVIVRRVTTAGAIRVAPISHEVEGIWGILWSGAAADTLGMVRAFDGTADGVWSPNGAMHTHGGKLR
jgi:hypothetical protein